MNKEVFAQYLNNIGCLNNESLPQILSLVEEYPYFQAAWVLALKNLHATKDIKFDNKLKKATAHISDRRLLQIILNDNFNIKVAKQEDSKTEAKVEVKVETTEEIVSQEVETENSNIVEINEVAIAEEPIQTATENEVPPTTISESDIKSMLEQQLLQMGIQSTITFEAGKANIIFDNVTLDERHKEQPVTLGDYKIEIKEQAEEVKSPETKKRKMSLIDDFLKSEAKIIPDRNYQVNSNLTTSSLLEDEELFSEKLANIYIKQQHYEKALSTYEKLYLKYPEKSIYFATKIEYVKRLINNK